MNLRTLGYFPVARHGQASGEVCWAVFENDRSICLRPWMPGPDHRPSATLTTRLLTASCFFGEPLQSGRSATGLTYFPQAREGLGEGVLFELSSASTLI
jgi:hypothetical protein